MERTIKCCNIIWLQGVLVGDTVAGPEKKLRPVTVRRSFAIPSSRAHNQGGSQHRSQENEDGRGLCRCLRCKRTATSTRSQRGDLVGADAGALGLRRLLVVTASHEAVHGAAGVGVIVIIVIAEVDIIIVVSGRLPGVVIVVITDNVIIVVIITDNVIIIIVIISNDDLRDDTDLAAVAIDRQHGLRIFTDAFLAVGGDNDAIAVADTHDTVAVTLISTLHDAFILRDAPGRMGLALMEPETAGAGVVFFVNPIEGIGCPGIALRLVLDRAQGAISL